MAQAQENFSAIELLTTTEAYPPIRYEGAKMIADPWKELGLKITVQPTELSSLLGKLYDQQDFTALISGGAGRIDRSDPQFLLGRPLGQIRNPARPIWVALRTQTMTRFPR